MSDLLTELEAEHTLIEAMLGSLRRYVQRRAQGEADAADSDAYLQFFREYAGHFHHAREEDVLLAALVEHAGVPGDIGPVAVITAEHAELAAVLSELAPLLVLPTLTAQQAEALQEFTVRYVHGLFHHIDAENSVLFPEGRQRLRRSGITLAGTQITEEAEAARDLALGLLERHPPLEDREVMRGDGCVMCPSYGVRCDGIERTWWTDQDWEDLEERAKHMD